MAGARATPSPTAMPLNRKGDRHARQPQQLTEAGRRQRRENDRAVASHRARIVSQLAPIAIEPEIRWFGFSWANLASVTPSGTDTAAP
jgi:hypothetical protein